MTKKELQAQINFLVSELKGLREGYNKLSDEALNDRLDKTKFYGMWQKADEKAERYGGLLCTIYNTIHAKIEDDVDYHDVIHQLIDDWHESEVTEYIFECSECGIAVSGVHKYCHKCGQRFKWED